MTPSVRACAGAIGALALLAPLPTPRADGTRDGVHAAVAEVVKLEDARRAAMIAADGKALSALFASDCTYIHSNGIAQSRGDLLTMLARGEIRYLAFTVESVEYRAYGETVVGTGTQTIELTNSGRPFTSRSRYTVVYARSDGGLKLAAYQSTPLPDVVMQEKRE
jgi:ketosteroid isomerase-like protein